MNKKLLLFFAVYAVLCLTIFSTMNITISNSYQRALAADATKDFIFHPSLSPSEAKDYFINQHDHYKIFSGIADWPPLQLMLLTLSFIVLGTNYFAWMITPLLLSLLALYYLFKITKHITKNEQLSYIAIAFASISTLFFYEAATPMLENGVAAFSLMCIYHMARYLETNKNSQLYHVALAFGLGFLLKTQMVFILPALAIMLFWKKKKEFNKTAIYKTIGVCFLIILAVNLPLIAREAVLMKEGLSTFLPRSVGRIEYITNEAKDLSGYLVAQDFEFESKLSEQNKQLIMNRYDLNYAQKFVIVLTSLFWNCILLPFIIYGLWKRKLSTIEWLLLLFVATNIILFSLHGLIPRYMIPSFLALLPFAALGIGKLPKKAILPTSAIVLFVILAQTLFLFNGIYNGQHIQSMQHDYDEAARYVLDNRQGEFTVVTTRLYQMAYHVRQHDMAQRAYVELVPEDKATFEQMLAGNFSTPKMAQDMGVAYDVVRPPVQYVIIHEGLETGPLAGSADYNVKELMNAYGTLETTIPSRFPNSQTFVYRVHNIYKSPSGETAP